MRKEQTGISTRKIFINVWLSILFISLLTGCANTLKNRPAEPSEIDLAKIENEWGIQIDGIRLSAGGYMLDFRYRVIDPEKAQPIFDRKEKPYLIDQASGAKFMVPSPPKVGPLRTSNPPQADRTYFILFANPGKYVKQGNKVTVVIGDFRAEDLTVN
ncbi:MAG: hypothetical protein AB1390_01280 [Nitrospirota bacterium]